MEDGLEWTRIHEGGAFRKLLQKQPSDEGGLVQHGGSGTGNRLEQHSAKCGLQTGADL